MRKIKEVLRLKFETGLSDRKIAEICNIGRPTVARYLRQALAAGLSWPLPSGLDEGALERLLFPQPPPAAVAEDRGPVPDWEEVHRRMRSKHATLHLLWMEYRLGNPYGYGYTWFCKHYRRWQGKRDVATRQDHKAGEKLFVDYAGQTMEVVVDGGDLLAEKTKQAKVKKAQVFVAVLGASGYIYAEATWSQRLQDWLGSHRRLFEYLGGVPEMVVPDNLRSAVTKPCRYEPEINRSYQDLADHYGIAVVPARVGKPKDKALVETCVQMVSRKVLEPLRERRFFSLGALNDAMRPLLEAMNDRHFQRNPVSRREQFERIDRPVLRPLPAEPYEFAEWKKARVNYYHHVTFDGNHYSAPNQLVGKELDLRHTDTTVELVHRGRRVASHRRSDRKGCYVTVDAHMSEPQRWWKGLSPEYFRRKAAEIGPAVHGLVDAVLASRRHEQQAFKSCQGILHLVTKKAKNKANGDIKANAEDEAEVEIYGADRVNAACERALAMRSFSYHTVESILAHGQDRQPFSEQRETPLPQNHGNIRGSSYYGASLFGEDGAGVDPCDQRDRETGEPRQGRVSRSPLSAPRPSVEGGRKRGRKREETESG